MSTMTIQGLNQTEFAGGGYLQNEGVFTFCVTECKDGEYVTGKAIKGGGLGIGLKVQDGPFANQIVGCSAGNPSPTHKDGGKFAQRRMVRFLVAANVVKPSQLNGTDIDFNPADAVHAFLVAEVVKGKNNDFLELKGDRVWHVDDPNIPNEHQVSENTLGLIDESARLTEKDFEPLYAGGAGKKQQPQQRVEEADLDAL